MKRVKSSGGITFSGSADPKVFDRLSSHSRSVRQSMSAQDYHRMKQHEEDDECQLFKTAMPSKFYHTKIKPPKKLQEEIQRSFNTKRQRMNKQVMIKNITDATNQKIRLLTADPMKSSSMRAIRTKYPRYMSCERKVTRLPENMAKKKIPFAYSDEKNPNVEFDPKLFD